LLNWRPRRHGCCGFTLIMAIFYKLIQLLLHSKVTKAELYLIDGYHNEWLELTCYIETLGVSLILWHIVWSYQIFKKISLELKTFRNKFWCNARVMVGTNKWWGILFKSSLKSGEAQCYKPTKKWCARAPRPHLFQQPCKDAISDPHLVL